jgi:hypothetical protein
MESRASLKRSMKVDLNKFVKEQELAGVTILNFHNCVTDASWMNEVLAYRLYRDAGVAASRTAYARLFVTVPGLHERRYFGLYSLVENVDDDFEQARFGSKKGALYKPVLPDVFGYSGEDWKAYDQAYDPKNSASAKEKRRVIEFAKLVTNGSDEEFARSVSDYLDLDEFARFLAVTVWLSSLDSILAVGQNYYLYQNHESGKYQFFPWDLDHSFGQFPMLGSQDTRENLSITKPWQGEKRFLERLFKLETFKKLYLVRMQEFSDTIFMPSRFGPQVEEIAAAIRPAVKEESEEKLGRFDRAVAGELFDRAPFGGTPPGQGSGDRRPGGPMFRRPSGMFLQVPPIKPFVKARARSVTDQLAGKSEGKTLESFGFGGPRGRGPGGPGFGPGTFLAETFKEALDADKDDGVTREEFNAGFARWYRSWNDDKSGKLTEEQLRAGMNRDLVPKFSGRGAPGPFGPPGGFGPPPGQ